MPLALVPLFCCLSVLTKATGTSGGMVQLSVSSLSEPIITRQHCLFIPPSAPRHHNADIMPLAWLCCSIFYLLLKKILGASTTEQRRGLAQLRLQSQADHSSLVSRIPKEQRKKPPRVQVSSKFQPSLVRLQRIIHYSSTVVPYSTPYLQDP